MPTSSTSGSRRYRSVWISDVHLGFRGCSADYLLRFLRTTECDHLYLVGDIIDIWALRKKRYWPQEHNNVIRSILGKAKHDTRVIYVPGNHDEMLRDFTGNVFGNITIAHQAVHETADGRRFLVVHGDEFDAVVRSSRLVGKIGSKLYDWLIRLNYVINAVRRRLGFDHWSLAAFLKHKVKNAVQYISRFEEAVAYAANKEGLDGVICGHIHRAEITEIQGVQYCNCGDWVESCTALVEHDDGRMEIITCTSADEQPVELISPVLDSAA